jgi:hypothetical protein
MESRTKSDVADTAFSSEVLVYASACDVVTRRKFVRSVGNAAHFNVPAATMNPNVKNIIVMAIWWFRVV